MDTSDNVLCEFKLPNDYINDYNNFCLFELTNYIQTEFSLLIQYDGYVLRPNKWKDYFLDFDYIDKEFSTSKFFSDHI